MKPFTLDGARLHHLWIEDALTQREQTWRAVGIGRAIAVSSTVVPRPAKVRKGVESPPLGLFRPYSEDGAIHGAISASEELAAHVNMTDVRGTR